MSVRWLVMITILALLLHQVPSTVLISGLGGGLGIPLGTIGGANTITLAVGSGTLTGLAGVAGLAGIAALGVAAAYLKGYGGKLLFFIYQLHPD